MILNRGVDSSTVTNAQNVSIVQPPAQATDASATLPTGFAERMYNYFTEHAPLIVSIWLFVILLMLIKMMAELAYLQKLRNQKVFQPAENWKEMVQRLGAEFSVSKPVTLLESALAKTPVVVGFFKPVILMPLSLLSNFSPEQIEAILRHELAHIRRNDYIVNMVQSVAEIIFFFNPSVWWISSLIRDEREHCCDELAINGNMNKRVFVEALLSFQEYQLAGRFAQGFAGPRYKMLHRVQRIFKINNKTAYPMTKIILTTCVVIAVAGLSAYADFRHQQQVNPKQNTMTQSENVSATDTIPAPPNSFKLTRNGKLYNLVFNNDVASYYIDGKQVTEQNMLAEDKEAFDALAALGQTQHELNNTAKGLENTRSGLNERRPELDAVRDNLGNIKEGLQDAAKKSAGTSAQIIDDLVKDKIITDRQATFSIAADKMTVNGKQQPADVHQRYKTKYLKDASMTLSNE
jgi:beta-lactamase regulating signal transducer with metallopeptidase domain